MRKLTMSLVLTLVMVFSATVSFAEMNGIISTTFATKFVSQKGISLHDDPVQQVNFFFTLPKGFYGNLWVSTPWDGEKNFGREIDYTIGWNGSVNGFNIDAGFSYFDLIDLFTSKYDIINPHLKVTKELLLRGNYNLLSYVTIEYPFVTDSWESGVCVYSGLKNVWDFKKFLVYQDVQVLYDQGLFGLEEAFIGKLSLGGSLKLSDSVALNSSVGISSPLVSKKSSGRQTEVVFSLGLAYNF